MSLLSPSITRKPTLTVKINDATLDAAFEVEVINTAHFCPDKFHVACAIKSLPADKSINWWSSVASVKAEIQVIIDGAPFSLVTGQIDDVDIDLVGSKLTLSGRDYSARFIDKKSSNKYVNNTASQIVAKLADSHGLKKMAIVNGQTVNTIQATKTRVGKYYQIDHVVLTQEQTEWELLIYLAKQEGFDLWVSGETVYFQPSPQETATPYPLIWQDNGVVPSANFIDIKMGRSLTLALDVIVEVRSWNQTQKKAFLKRAKRLNSRIQNSGPAQIYRYTIANLTPEQCQMRANTLLAEITRHERLIEVELPGDNILSTRQQVRLTGTGTAWDQNYYPDTIERRISFDRGYSMHLRAKNHSPLSDPTI